MSLEGNQLLQDFKQWLSLFADILKDKNKDEILQQFVYHARLSVRMTKMEKKRRNRFKVKFPDQNRTLYIGDVSKEEEKIQQLRSQLQSTVNTFYNLLNQILTSREFRSIFNDLLKWFQDCFTPKPTITKVIKEEVHMVEDPLHRLKRQVRTTEMDVDKLENDEDVQMKTSTTHRLETITEESEYEEILHSPIVATSHAAKTDETMKVSHVEKDLVDRLGSILKDLCSNEKYLNAMKGIFQLFKTEPKEFYEAMPAEWYYDANMLETRNDLLKIMQRFANNVDLTNMYESSNQLFRSLQTDFELKDFFRDSVGFVEKCTPAFINSDEFRPQCEFLIKRLQAIHNQKYSKLFDSITQGVDDFSMGLEKDKQTTEFGALTRKILTKDLFGIGEHQKSKFKIPLFSVNVFKDLRYFAIPAIMSNWRYMPIPRLEIDDNDYNIVFEDIVLDFDDFIPAVVDIDSSQHIHTNPKTKWFGKKTATPDQWRYSSNILVSNLNVEITNIKFMYRKKRGFMKMRDSGYLDFLIGKKGIEVKVNMKSDEELFHAESIKAKIDSLKLKFHGTKHQTRWKLYSPFIQKKIKKELEHAIESKIDYWIKSGNQTMTKYFIATPKTEKQAHLELEHH